VETHPHLFFCLQSIEGSLWGSKKSCVLFTRQRSYVIVSEEVMHEVLRGEKEDEWKYFRDFKRLDATKVITSTQTQGMGSRL